MTEKYINVLKVFLLLFSVFGLAEFLYVRNIPPYVTRKVVHIGGGLVSALLPLFVKLNTAVFLGAVLFLLLLFSKRKKMLKSVHEGYDDSFGASFFAPGLIVTALLFWPINPLIFQGAALVLGLSDGIAGIVGVKYGKKKYNITGVKTIEGSVTFFLVTIFVLCFVVYISGGLVPDSVFGKSPTILGASLVLTLVEAALGKGWDNLFIPIIAGTILVFIL